MSGSPGEVRKAASPFRLLVVSASVTAADLTAGWQRRALLCSGDSELPN